MSIRGRACCRFVCVAWVNEWCMLVEAVAGRSEPVEPQFPPVWHRPYRRFLKRGFDVLAVLLAPPVVLPVVLLLGLLIARDGGPVFYRQYRVGRGGRPFRIWKLRSMVVGAEKRLEEHLARDPLARAEWAATQKLKSDPRITPVGRLIRKSSLDELPSSGTC